MNDGILRFGEKLSLRLKELYLSYGYSEFRLSSFEEYSLYAENRSFLSGRDVISFSVGGRLLALRPDVTLSVAKNVNVESGVKKLFYNEKVYRRIEGGNFSEVDQIGVEVLGEVDLCAEAEVTSLALKTLKAVGQSFVLDISHVGIISKAVSALSLTDSGRAFALSCLEHKNAHDFIKFAGENGVNAGLSAAFVKLITLPTEPEAALSVLKEVSEFNIDEEVGEISQLFSLTKSDALNINFSAVGDEGYYNGLVFKGYVKGVPHAILSGGRYDKLLNKFSKSAQAIGFALYSGELEKYFSSEKNSPDGAVLYDDCTAYMALSTADNLREKGKKILLCRNVPKDFVGDIYSAEGKLVKGGNMPL